jgi:acyl-CoA thioesterase FadM
MRRAAPARTSPSTMNEPLSFTTAFTVEWGDCDPARIVFYPHYFYWFDTAFQHWLRSAGLSQALLTERYGVVGTPILEAHAKFLVASTDGDRLLAEARIEKFGPKRFRIDYRLMRGAQLLVEGWEVRAWVAKVGDRLRSLPIPPEFGEALAKVSIDEIRPVRVGHDRPHW